MFTVPSNRSSGSATRSRSVPNAVYAAAFSVSVSAIRSALLADEEDPVRGTSHRAADVDEVPFHIDLLDAEIRLRMPRGAVVPRHLLPLDHARRIRSGTDRARPAVLGVAVRVRSATDPVALDDALKAAPLRRAGDLHPFPGGEDVHLHHVAGLVGRDLRLLARCVIGAEASRHCWLRLESGLGGVSRLRLRGAASARRALSRLRRPARALLPVPELNGRVPHPILLVDEHHRIRRRLDDRHGYLLSRLVEDLGHPQLLANDSDHKLTRP